MMGGRLFLTPQTAGALSGGIVGVQQAKRFGYYREMMLHARQSS
jgi:hypothetical protein